MKSTLQGGEPFSKYINDKRFSLVRGEKNEAAQAFLKDSPID